jgi:hypothetical protein
LHGRIAGSTDFPHCPVEFGLGRLLAFGLDSLAHRLGVAPRFIEQATNFAGSCSQFGLVLPKQPLGFVVLSLGGVDVRLDIALALVQGRRNLRPCELSEYDHQQYEHDECKKRQIRVKSQRIRP